MLAPARVSPASSWSSTISLLAISTQQALSTMGVSRSSSCVCLRRQDGHGGFDDGRIAHSGVEVAGGERGGRGPADAAAARVGVRRKARAGGDSPGSSPGRS